MGYPGAYAPVISVGSAGWTGEWSNPDAPGNYYRMWWLQYGQYPVLPNAGNVADPTSVNDLYVSDFSSRALQGQQLDVLAPGSWVRGPFPGDPAYQHLPWWSNGRGVFRSPTPLANFYFVGGTSMATPHVASVAALMLQKSPTLGQAQVESILKANTLPMPDTGSRFVLEVGTPTTVNWDTSCGNATCDPVGAGFLQADKALRDTLTRHSGLRRGGPVAGAVAILGHFAIPRPGGLPNSCFTCEGDEVLPLTTPSSHRAFESAGRTAHGGSVFWRYSTRTFKNTCRMIAASTGTRSVPPSSKSAASATAGGTAILVRNCRARGRWQLLSAARAKKAAFRRAAATAGIATPSGIDVLFNGSHRGQPGGSPKLARRGGGDVSGRGHAAPTRDMGAGGARL
jgi:hypothetical protein